MVYRILKVLCRITIHSYFRRVKVSGKENIPSKGPYIFVANHPSAFMDPIVAATFVKPPVYFMAAAEYLGKGFLGKIIQRTIHAIPVYRPSTRPEDTHKNKDMFKSCFEHLDKKGALMVFPEGVSVTEKKIKPLKSGVARIARGAELRNAMELGLTIIPMGLNYSNPHLFRSNLFVQIGEPIIVKDFISDDESKEFEEVNALTELMERKMKEAVLHIENEEDETLLTKLNAIYARNIRKDFDIDSSEQNRSFKMQKDMIDAIEHFQENDPQKYSDAKGEIENYLNELNSCGFSDHDIMNLNVKPSPLRTLLLILGFPIYLIGLINNLFPYKLVGYILNKFKIKGTFIGSIMLASGLVIFLFWYSIITTLLVLFSPLGLWSLLYPFIMYTSGIYCIIYWKSMSFANGRRLLRKAFQNNKEKVQELIQMRAKLIQNLDKAKEIFLKNQD